uniref:Uncharacterized protein n=1 Tax=Cryptococcus bacillisporus CA1280 TaxID=1296109 RepID=A0A0D0VB03_CRYGA|nr:hypothetical protein I312_06094 [Cryptococcus bacillisporus CA1280]
MILSKRPPVHSSPNSSSPSRFSLLDLFSCPPPPHGTLLTRFRPLNRCKMKSSRT